MGFSTISFQVSTGGAWIVFPIDMEGLWWFKKEWKTFSSSKSKLKGSDS